MGASSIFDRNLSTWGLAETEAKINHILAETEVDINQILVKTENW